MKLTFHTYWRQVGNAITKSRRTFPTRLEVMPESTSYLQEFSLQASSCPVTPSSLSPGFTVQTKPNEEVEIWGRKPSPLQCLQEDCQPVTQATALTAAKRSYFPLPVTSKGRTLGREGGWKGGSRTGGRGERTVRWKRARITPPHLREGQLAGRGGRREATPWA